ncbi:hypothetical protein [Pedobacter africanus]|uniref:Uncharacterized protein n=1 Tax=Pedobacter africanus TaxID=151894 RepID=A0A1W2AZ20_9SPHI|nr:hypothetical protein [Pedobacter africanus]SMC65933.1 hypothetical protein SAMN04488524_1773 [Pedobacter africanus]
MKAVIVFVFTMLTATVFGQNKYNYTKITEIEGTSFVISTIESWGKSESAKNQYWLFIDTKNGQVNRMELPVGGWFNSRPEQVKIDELDINIILVAVQCIDMDGKNGIDYSDPRQIAAVSTDGTKRTQLTDDKLYVLSWAVNKKTGTLVVTGYYDLNNNRKYDITDKNEISIYDLKTLKLTTKI